LFIYQSSIISQILNLTYWMVTIFVWDTCGITHSCHQIVRPLMLMSSKVCNAFWVHAGAAILDILVGSLVNSSSFWSIMKAVSGSYILGYLSPTIYKWNSKVIISATFLVALVGNSGGVFSATFLTRWGVKCHWKLIICLYLILTLNQVRRLDTLTKTFYWAVIWKAFKSAAYN